MKFKLRFTLLAACLLFIKCLQVLYPKLEQVNDYEDGKLYDTYESTSCNPSIRKCALINNVTSRYNHKSSFTIWDTDSGHDRINKQIAHIPKNMKTRSDDRTRIILLDTGPLSWNVEYGSLTFADHNCPVYCIIVDRSIKDLAVDAILFGKGLDFVDEYSHTQRTQDQVWIAYALDSPYNTDTFINDIEVNVFNWTVTYRQDSTITLPYAKWTPFDNATLVKRKRNYALGKSKMAAIYMSNCDSFNDKLGYVSELKKWIDLDIYGTCGDMHCPGKSIKKSNCSGTWNRDYKFYLSFEEANCREFITDEFFVTGLGHNVIPIVMGGHPDDYAEVAPPKSYIHVDDFQSPKELAQYMEKLDRDDDLYNEYFNWKGTGIFIDTKFWCRLCSMVSDSYKPTLVVEDLETWWNPTDMCTAGRWK